MDTWICESLSLFIILLEKLGKFTSGILMVELDVGLEENNERDTLLLKLFKFFLTLYGLGYFTISLSFKLSISTKSSSALPVSSLVSLSSSTIIAFCGGK